MFTTQPYEYNCLLKLNCDDADSLSHTTVADVSRFVIDTDDLLVGDNVIALTFTSTSGSSVTRIFTVRKVQTVTFAPSCNAVSQADGRVVFTCSHGSSSNAIQTIRYSINDGSEITGMFVLFSGIKIFTTNIHRHVLI